MLCADCCKYTTSPKGMLLTNLIDSLKLFEQFKQLITSNDLSNALKVLDVYTTIFI